jgi:hypothetical protein
VDTISQSSIEAPDLGEVFETAFGLTDRLFVTQGSPITILSDNWSGARVIREKTSNSKFVAVWAAWVVPKVIPPKGASSGEWYSASWVGLDGGTWKLGTPWSKDVLQAGIVQNVTRDASNRDKEHYAAWYGWDPGDNSPPTYLSSSEFPVEPNDSMFVLVQSPISRDESAVAHFVNYTRKKHLSKSISKPATLDWYRGDSVQWVMERPYNAASNVYYEFADYQRIEFTLWGGLRSDLSIVAPESGNLIVMNGNDPATIISQPSFDQNNLRIDWMGAH